MKQIKTSLLRAILCTGGLSLGLMDGGLVQAQETPAAPAAPAAPVTSAPTTTTPKESEAPMEFPQGILFPYSLLDAAFAGNVDKEGHVNYVGMQNNTALKWFIKAVETADLSKFPVLQRRTKVVNKFGEEEEKSEDDHSAELVFWINAYNAHVVNAVLQAYPISSPDNIANFDTAKTHRVAGKDYSFAEMRKKIVSLDPRAFFALTNGTLSGPRLSPTAYRLVGLDNKLDRDVSLFVSDPSNVQLLIITNEVTLNPLFQEADALFKSKAERGKWTGIRRLLADYSIISTNKRFFTTNFDTEIKFMRPQRVLNRNPNLSPVAG